MHTDYGLAAALRARLMGGALVAAGILLVVVTVLVAAGLPIVVLTVLVVLIVVGVFVLGSLLVRRWYVLRLDDVGYQVRFVRGVGARTARWVDVVDLQTVEVGGARCLQLRLKDGRTTTVPVDVVAGDSEELVRAVRDRLQRGSGRRPRR